MSTTQEDFNNAIEHEARRLRLSPLEIGGVVLFDLGEREVSASLYCSYGQVEGEIAGSSDGLLSLLKCMKEDTFADEFWSKCDDFADCGAMAYDKMCSQS